jgi:hypothetical protein
MTPPPRHHLMVMIKLFYALLALLSVNAWWFATSCSEKILYAEMSNDRAARSMLHPMDEGMNKPRITHRTLTNYTSGQAFDPIVARVMDKESVYEHLDYSGLNKSQPLIYFITPTYRRVSQMVDLVRLGQTLHMDPGIYWIVVEDAENCTKRVRDLVERMGRPYAHVAVPTVKELPPKKHPHRGVDQRNRALEVVESLGLPGVVYFGDDDNAYDGEINCVILLEFALRFLSSQPFVLLLLLLSVCLSVNL